MAEILITEKSLEEKLKCLPAQYVKATDVSSGCGQKFEVVIVSRYLLLNNLKSKNHCIINLSINIQ